MDEVQNVGLARFNAGIAKLKRIDKLKALMHYSRQSDDFKTWMNCLEGWREEMSERMDDTEDKECDRHEKKIKSTLSLKYDDPKIAALKKYGIYLSKLEYRFGMSLPDKEDIWDTLENV